MDLSIVILNYKSKGFTMACLKSIKEANFGNLKYEVFVVDNDSDDSIGEILAWQYPDIKFVQNKKNLGMGAGNNVGIRKALGKYIVVMNPDTLVFPNTFLKLYQYMEENSAVGAAGPMQLNPDKSIQDSCYRRHGLLTPLYRRMFLGNFSFAKKDISRFLMNDFKHNSIKEVDWLLGSFLFLRAESLKDAGMFDERYFMYFEDTDLCRSFWQKKWKVIYNPQAKIIHNHNRDSAKTPWYKFFSNKATRCHIISWLKYLRKWGFSSKKFQNN